MTVIVRSKNRVVLPVASPGDEFHVQTLPDGTIILKPALSRPAKVRQQKRHGFTVGVLDRPINEKALEEALAEFP